MLINLCCDQKAQCCFSHLPTPCIMPAEGLLRSTKGIDPTNKRTIENKKWLVISSYRVLWGRKRPAVLNGISPKQSPNHSNRLAVPASPAVDPVAPSCPQAFLYHNYRSHLQLSQLAATAVTGNKFRLDSFKLNKYRRQIGLWPIPTSFGL